MKILIPTQLQKLVGKPELQYYIEGAEKGMDIENLISRLCEDYPEIKHRILDEQNNVNKFLNIYVNDEDIRFLNGKDTFLRETDVVSIIPAIAGG